MTQTTTKDAYQLLHAGASAFANMEAIGLRIDTAYLTQAQKDAAQTIKEGEDELRADPIYKIWKKRYGFKAKLGSKEQLAHVIFDILKCPRNTDTTATGRYKVDEAAFADVNLPFVKAFFRVEKLKKAKGTYLDGIESELADGRIHPNFNLHTTRSHRSSADLPNVQNVPTRDSEMGAIVRRCFIPSKGCVLAEIDYGTLEVRAAAWLHQDPTMLDYIADPTKDLHRDMAMQIYCLRQDQVEKKTTRFAAKGAFVFAQFYGDYYVHCAKNLWNYIDQLKMRTTDGIPIKRVLRDNGITQLGLLNPKETPRAGTFEKHLRDVEEDFWGRRFRVYGEWKKRWYADYQRNGGFTILTGFRMDGVYSRNEVINLPIQSIAFHCLLWSLIQLDRWLVRNKMRTRIINEIHDSMLLDLYLPELDDVLDKAVQIMTVDLPKAWPWICTPLLVEVEVGEKNWFDKVKWECGSKGWRPAERGR